MKLHTTDSGYILELNPDELDSLDNILDNACAFTRDDIDTQRLLELGGLISTIKEENNKQ